MGHSCFPSVPLRFCSKQFVSDRQEACLQLNMAMCCNPGEGGVVGSSEEITSDIV